MVKQMRYNNENIWIIDLWINIDEFQKHYPDWEKPVSKGYIFCTEHYMAFWKSKMIGTTTKKRSMIFGG